MKSKGVHLAGFAPAVKIARAAAAPLPSSPSAELSPDKPDKPDTSDKQDNSDKLNEPSSDKSTPPKSPEMSNQSSDHSKKRSHTDEPGPSAKKSKLKTPKAAKSPKMPTFPDKEKLQDEETPSPDRALEMGDQFKPLTLPEIQARLAKLQSQLPAVLPPVPSDDPDVGIYPGACLGINIGDRIDHVIQHSDVTQNTDDITKNNDVTQNTNQVNNQDPTGPIDAQSTQPNSIRNETHRQIRQFASSLQFIVEQYNLLLSMVGNATYRWGDDRTGASQQNLAVMNSELQQCQETLQSMVCPRLSNVLCPTVDTVIKEVCIIKDSTADRTNKHQLNGNKDTSESSPSIERRINKYGQTVVDPHFVHLCHKILARNAPMIRQVMATCLHSSRKVIGDYLKATKKDGNHGNAGRGYAF